jgi:hypothetical protein
MGTEPETKLSATSWPGDLRWQLSLGHLNLTLQIDDRYCVRDLSQLYRTRPVTT